MMDTNMAQFFNEAYNQFYLHFVRELENAKAVLKTKYPGEYTGKLVDILASEIGNGNNLKMEVGELYALNKTYFGKSLSNEDWEKLLHDYAVYGGKSEVGKKMALASVSALEEESRIEKEGEVA